MYEDRVREVATAIEQEKLGGILTSEVKSVIEDFSIRFNITEVTRTGGRQAINFINDVKKILKVKRLRENNSYQYRYTRLIPRTDEHLRMLADKVQDALGQSFPDGDPIDIIAPWCRRMGWEMMDINEKGLLDKAVRKFIGPKTYYKFLEGFWDEFAGDNPENEMGVTKETNPWRGN